MDDWKCVKKPRLESCRRHDLECAFRLVADYLVQPSSDSDSDPQFRCESPVDQLRRIQPLAAVCHSWRRAVLPLFYQTVVCSISEPPNPDSHTTTPTVNSGYSNYIQRTNMGIVLSSGHQKYARRLAIDLVGDVSPDQPITLLADIGFGGSSWPKIKTLHWSHRHRHRHNQAYSVESLARLNAYLLHTLPKLTSISYVSPDDQRHYPEFPLDGLLSSTLSRLTDVRITSGLVPDMCSSAFLPCLVSLTLRSPIYAGAAHLPRIFAETLEYLHIGFSSTESIWDRFYVADDAQTVHFKQLRSLVLEYSEAIDDERRIARALKKNRLYGDCDPAELNSADGLYAYHSDDSSHRLGTTIQRPSAIHGNLARPVFLQLQQLSILKYPFPISRVLRHFKVDSVPHISIRDIRKGWNSIDAAMVLEMSSLRVHITHPFDSRIEEQHYQVWVNRLFSVSSRLTNLQLQAPTTLPLSFPDVIGLTRLVTLLQHLVAYVGLEVDCGISRRLAGDEDDEDPLEIERELVWLMARIPKRLRF
ncbi:hypothetical protein H4218_006322 [Coemansia sp. IMI 209128]|nr:hypothetical protein H4218_006322 [Coemansia sp. IMI 209128]